MLVLERPWTKQPPPGVRLTSKLRRLGFTHAWNFAHMSPPNLIRGGDNLGHLQVFHAAGRGGVGPVCTTTSESRYNTGVNNVFASSTCSVFVIEAMVGEGPVGQGQCITESRYSAIGDSNSGGLQLRKATTGYQIIRAQQAVTLSALDARRDGQVNAAAFSIAGNNGRHAAFAKGFLINSATPTTTYIHGVSAIGNSAFNVSQDTRCLGGLLFLAWAPVVVSDGELANLTSANPWQLFVSRQIYIPSSAAPTLPTLSAATATDITATSFRPRVSYAY